MAFRSMISKSFLCVPCKNVTPASTSSFTCIALNSDIKQRIKRLPVIDNQRSLHVGQPFFGWKHWEKRNEKIYPPQLPGEPRRPAELYYVKRKIKHSKKNMWYAAKFVHNMMIDDAISQLLYINKKAARIVREALLEAQEEAVREQHVEYKSNLHVAQSFVGKGKYEHALRIHAKGRSSRLDLVYSHYFLCLKEGPPPEPYVVTGYDQAEDYIKALRNRTVLYSL